MEFHVASFHRQLISLFVYFFNYRSDRLDAERLASFYSPLLHDLMTRKQSKVHRCVIDDVMKHQPEVGVALSEELIKFTAKAVQPYRKVGLDGGGQLKPIFTRASYNLAADLCFGKTLRQLNCS